eukprot:2659780-Rhodomonas_salina.7
MQCYDSSGLHYVKDRPKPTTSGTRTLAGSGSSLQKGLQTRLTNEYAALSAMCVVVRTCCTEPRYAFYLPVLTRGAER